MAKHTARVEALKEWRNTLKTKIVEKKDANDPTEKGITKTYSRAKNTY